MDRTGRHPVGELCPLIRRSKMGFCSKSFRFEGGGRNIRLGIAYRLVCCGENGRFFWTKGPSIKRYDLVLVVGLNRTGKSCRLRWVNYLHPGLKRGKMTQQEERLVLELHAKWGNRWSKIARKLPGRTDNEIKNYWRTHMRKKAQEKKRCVSPTNSSSSNCNSSSSMTTATTQDTGGSNGKMNQECEDGYYSMDDIWREIDQSGTNLVKPVRDVYYSEQSCFLNLPPLASPRWESSLESIWNMDANESKMSSSFGIDQFPLSFEHGRSSWSSSLAD